MKHDITLELAELFSKKATAMGYSVRNEAEEHDPKLLLTAFKGQEEICRFEKTGAMRFWRDSPFVEERKELHSLLLDLKERNDLYLNAKPLDCEGVRDFRLISEFGNHLLAAKQSKDNEIRFVTWQYDYDRTGVTLGHYYENNYQGALKDFTVRSGLIDENQLFSVDEMAVLYASCVFRGRHDDDLTFDSEKDLQAVIEKLESNLPQQSMEQETVQEQEDEHGI
ncbi:hypothetical protein QA584_08650 [Anaerocolumna sp. AGMB13025]|uniref:hypothetical protein n=1 Tax=Anaerocolumna sp. AGMB13025 TaxID=3039116 RepID=UPI00241D62A5|nr:hypothetical protein [Anaerocolumna sp. AGMB13025]WFR59140.1 hypothetical protein QA584_08650 [Anaerocolumna sp. AGMB13025]